MVSNLIGEIWFCIRQVIADKEKFCSVMNIILKTYVGNEFGYDSNFVIVLIMMGEFNKILI